MHADAYIYIYIGEGRVEGFFPHVGSSLAMYKCANAAVRFNFSVYCLDVLGDQSTIPSFFMYSSRSWQCAGI